MDKTQRTRPWQKRGFERSNDKDQSGSEDCDRRPDVGVDRKLRQATQKGREILMSLSIKNIFKPDYEHYEGVYRMISIS